jgi:hypothetical protein
MNTSTHCKIREKIPDINSRQILNPRRKYDKVTLERLNKMKNLGHPIRGVQTFIHTDQNDMPLFSPVTFDEQTLYGHDPYNFTHSYYQTVNSGDLTYWVSQSSRSMLHGPNFSLPAKEQVCTIKEPNKSERQEFLRKPVKSSSADCIFSLSFIQDTTEHREDLMSLQMRKYNSRSYELQY